jgi:hypothetical protein
LPKDGQENAKNEPFTQKASKNTVLPIRAGPLVKKRLLEAKTVENGKKWNLHTMLQ